MLEIAKKQDFDAVVVCSSIPPFLREQIVRQLKRVKPSMPLIVLCEAEECDAFKKLAEIVIAPPGISQQPLMEAIARAISQSEAKARGEIAD